MHELSVAMALVEAAVSEARAAGALRVTRVGCRIGILRQVNAELLREAFNMARHGVTAEAALDVHTDGLALLCRGCGHSCGVSEFTHRCPKCHGDDIALSGGDALELTTLELDLAEATT